MAALTSGTLHYAIIRNFVDTGAPPTVGALAAVFDTNADAVANALRRLADDHGVVLFPGTADIRVAHPFSAVPTGFRVRQGARSWWGNCAWCSLGIAGLIDGQAAITTTLGATDREITIHVTDGAVTDSDLLVHFPVPMTKVWNDVIYACSTMMVFDHEAKIEEWCAANQVAKGDIQPLGNVWPFAREWYGRHLDEDWRKWTVAEAREIFRRHDLSGPIWHLPDANGRF